MLLLRLVFVWEIYLTYNSLAQGFFVSNVPICRSIDRAVDSRIGKQVVVVRSIELVGLCFLLGLLRVVGQALEVLFVSFPPL